MNREERSTKNLFTKVPECVFYVTLGGLLSSITSPTFAHYFKRECKTISLGKNGFFEKCLDIVYMMSFKFYNQA